MKILRRIGKWFFDLVLSVPVGVKIIGIGLLPVLILGLSLNYWVTRGLSDWLSYFLEDARVKAAMSAGSRSVLLVTILAAIASILLSLLLTYILTRPLLVLREMARKVTKGQLGTRAPVWAQDEIGELAIAVNTMTDHLVASQENLTRQNRNLDMINRIALAADQQIDIHDALYKILELILKVLQLKTGWVYLHDPERQVLHLASWFGVPEDLGEHLVHSTGKPVCACQEDLVRMGVGAANVVRTCSRLESSGCTQYGTAHFTIPLRARDQNFGVINLLCNPGMTISQDTMELLNLIGTQVSEIVADAWLRLKLVEKETARQILLESLVRAQEQERARLARELHDGAGQTLTSLLVRLKTMERKVKSQDQHKKLEEMQEIVSQTVEQIRELSYRLHPAALEEFGLPTALETLIQETAGEAGLSATCECDLNGNPLSDEIQVTLYRIAQEGLTNVVQHAAAERVEFKLKCESGEIVMTIEDNG